MKIRGVSTARGALWAARALHSTRRDLRRRGLAAVAVPPPPALPSGARRGVMVVLSHSSPTCLERALVLQRWLASQGIPRDVVIGISGRGKSFAAHAWIEGESGGEGFNEISRYRAVA